MQFEENDPPPEPLWTAISVLVGTGATLLFLFFGSPIDADRSVASAVLGGSACGALVAYMRSHGREALRSYRRTPGVDRATVRRVARQLRDEEDAETLQRYGRIGLVISTLVLFVLPLAFLALCLVLWVRGDADFSMPLGAAVIAMVALFVSTGHARALLKSFLPRR